MHRLIVVVCGFRLFVICGETYIGDERFYYNGVIIIIYAYSFEVYNINPRTHNDVYALKDHETIICIKLMKVFFFRKQFAYRS